MNNNEFTELIRILRFETMEPRIALAADSSPLDAASILAELRDTAQAETYDANQILALLGDLNRSQRPPAPPQFNPPIVAEEVPDGPLVQFRIDVRDADGREVTSPEAGLTYLAKIFVQDTRVSDADPLGNGSFDYGGVFHAMVDLEFSDNLRVLDDALVSDAFDGHRTESLVDDRLIRNLGGTSRSLSPPGRAEQLLVEVPFVVENTDVTTRIAVSPSASSNESVLLHGFQDAIPSQNITPDAREFVAVSPPLLESDTSPLPPIRDEDLTPLPAPTRPSFDEASTNADDRTPTGPTQDAIVLVSFIPVPDRNAWRPWADQGRDRLDAELDRSRGSLEKDDDEWTELEWPVEADQARKQSSGKQRNPVAESDEEEDDSSDEERRGSAKTDGLFFDENLFLEGAIIEPFRSRFQLHLKIFSPDPNPMRSGPTSSRVIPPQRASKTGELIDLAEILRPDKPIQPWKQSVDEVIAMETPALPPAPDRPMPHSSETDAQPKVQ